MPAIILTALRWLGLKGGVILALILALGVQQARIEGFLWIDGYKDQIASLWGSLAKIESAQKEAKANAIAAKAETERKYAQKAMEADREHQTELADARASADAYIRAHRVPAGTCGASSGAVAAGGDSDTGVPASVPANVIVAEADVRACTDLYTYGVKAHDWALSLSQHEPH